MYDTRSDANWTLVIGLVIIVLFLVGGFAIKTVFYDPVQAEAQRRAFSGQVSGLVADYCTAPRPNDQEDARQQLISVALNQPNQWTALPTDMQSRAQLVRDNNRTEACK